MKNWEEIFLTFEADFWGRSRKSANHGLPAFVRSLRNLNINGYYRLQKWELLRLRVTWSLPEVSILGADQKDRGLWGREWKQPIKKSNFLTWPDLRPPARSGNEIIFGPWLGIWYRHPSSFSKKAYNIFRIREKQLFLLSSFLYTSETENKLAQSSDSI